MTRRTGLIAAGIAVVVVGVAFVVLLGRAILNAPETPPRITAYANGTTIQVDPFRYCPVDAPLCDYEGTTASIPMRAGNPLQLSIPPSISGGPWGLATVYGTRGGSDDDIVETDEYYGPGDRTSVTVPQLDADGLPLLGVEIRLPSGVIDADTAEEEIVSHAVWSIATTPEGTD